MRILIADDTYSSPERDGGSRALHDLHRSLLDLGHATQLVNAVHPAKGDPWDTIFLSRPIQAMRWFPQARAAARRTIYLGHDMHHLRMAAECEAQGQSIAPARAMAAIERACWRSHDIALYPDATECALVAAAGCKARWFPYFRIDECQADVPIPARTSPPLLLFVGGASHKPNVLGLAWFARDVMPTLAEFGAQVVVVGHWPEDARMAFRHTGIAFAGVQSDVALAAMRRQATALIAPLTCGAGLKCKVIEAMASGTPLITTSIGLQGIENDEEVAFVADRTADWSAALRSVARGEGQVRQRTHAAISYVKRRHGRDAYLSLLDDILGDEHND